MKILEGAKLANAESVAKGMGFTKKDIDAMAGGSKHMFLGSLDKIQGWLKEGSISASEIAQVYAAPVIKGQPHPAAIFEMLPEGEHTWVNAQKLIINQNIPLSTPTTLDEEENTNDRRPSLR